MSTTVMTRSGPAPITAMTRCDAPVAVITSSPGAVPARSFEGTSTFAAILMTRGDLRAFAIRTDYEVDLRLPIHRLAETIETIRPGERRTPSGNQAESSTMFASGVASLLRSSNGGLRVRQPHANSQVLSIAV